MTIILTGFGEEAEINERIQSETLLEYLQIWKDTFFSLF